MLTIEYAKTKGLMYIKTGKGKPMEIRADANTVNEYSLFYLKKYFSDTIIKLCSERTNTYDHIYVKMDTKKEFFLRVKANIEGALKLSTWKSYLASCLKNLREYAPSTNSRYYHNYMERIEMMEAVLSKYLNTEKYYTEQIEQYSMKLFDNQDFMCSYYY